MISHVPVRIRKPAGIGHHQADAEHGSGDREGRRRHDVDQRGEPRAVARDDVADRNADQGRAAGREAGEQQRVGERPVGALEQLREIVGREAGMQHRPAVLHERDHHHGGERHQRGADHDPAIGGAEAAQRGADRDERRGAARAGRVVAARQHAALDQQRGDGADDQQHAEHAGGGRIVGGLADEQLVGLDREDRPVLGEHERHAEILQRLDEHQQPAGEDRRQHERQRDGAQHARARGAEVLRGLLDRDVDRLEGRGDRQHDVRVERQRVDRDDALGAVDRVERNAERLQRAGHDAGAAEQQHQRIGADERRQHQRQCGEREQRRLAADRQPREAEGERHADQHGEHRGRAPRC